MKKETNYVDIKITQVVKPEYKTEIPLLTEAKSFRKTLVLCSDNPSLTGISEYVTIIDKLKEANTMIPENDAILSNLGLAYLCVANHKDTSTEDHDKYLSLINKDIFCDTDENDKKSFNNRRFKPEYKYLLYKMDEGNDPSFKDYKKYYRQYERTRVLMNYPEDMKYLDIDNLLHKRAVLARDYLFTGHMEPTTDHDVFLGVAISGYKDVCEVVNTGKQITLEKALLFGELTYAMSEIMCRRHDDYVKFYINEGIKIFENIVTRCGTYRDNKADKYASFGYLRELYKMKDGLTAKNAVLKHFQISNKLKNIELQQKEIKDIEPSPSYQRFWNGRQLFARAVYRDKIDYTEIDRRMEYNIPYPLDKYVI